MTVKELVEALASMPQDAEVFFDSGLDDDPVCRINSPEYNAHPDKRLNASWDEEDGEDFEPDTGTVPAVPGVFL